MKKKIQLMDGIHAYLKGRKAIFDVGTGPNGSEWWNHVDKDAMITGVDLYLFPAKVPKRVAIYKMDADGLASVDKKPILERIFPASLFKKTESVKWENRFDMIVANHVLEHVNSPEKVIKGMSKMLMRDGIVYAGFPESTNFTDIFYHLVHPNGGGHIQLLTRDVAIKMFEDNGFALVSCKVWPDDWGWFRKLYNWKNYMWPDNPYLDQKKIDYLCDTFMKELTPEKGYFYGWEMIFKKL